MIVSYMYFGSLINTIIHINKFHFLEKFGVNDIFGLFHPISTPMAVNHQSTTHDFSLFKLHQVGTIIFMILPSTKGLLKMIAGHLCTSDLDAIYFHSYKV